MSYAISFTFLSRNILQQNISHSVEIFFSTNKLLVDESNIKFPLQRVNSKYSCFIGFSQLSWEAVVLFLIETRGTNGRTLWEPPGRSRMEILLKIYLCWLILSGKIIFSTLIFEYFMELEINFFKNKKRMVIFGLFSFLLIL